MKEKFKKLTVELSDKLQDQTNIFLIKVLKKEQDTSDIINLVLSSHLSSAFTTMNLLSSQHKEMNVLVNKFIKDVQQYISSLEVIRKVEVIK